MGRHRRPTARIPWRRLRAEYARLRRLYEQLEADHCQLVGDLEALKPRRPAQTSWGVRNEDMITTAPLAVVEGMAPAQASALTHRAGLLRSPGGAWPEGPRGTTG